MKFFTEKTLPVDKKLFCYSIFVVVLLMIEPIALVSLYETTAMSLLLIRYSLLCFVLWIGFVYFILCVLPKIYINTMAIMLVLALFSLKFSFYSAITTLDDAILIGLFVLLIVFVSVGLKQLKKKNVTIKASVYLLTAFIALMSPAKMMLFSNTIAPTNFDSDEIIPEFVYKPNIYLLSYDSLVPEYPIRTSLNIPTLPYKSVFEKDFYVLNAGMSFHVPTRLSINNLMRLGQKKVEIDIKSFSGSSSSYLQRILKANGYHIVNGYRGLYFGTSGPFVDESLIPDYAIIEYSVLCVSQNGIERSKLFGICITAKIFKKYELNTLYKLIFSSDKNVELSDFHDRLVQTITKNIDREEPVFSFTYTYKPIGHTSGSYNHDDLDDRERYRKKFISFGNRLRNEVSEILGIIKEKDPSALVMVFGDHGPYLSRQIKADDDPQFYYEDRNGILLAVAKTKHHCSKRFADFRAHTYNTPSRALIEIFACLSNNNFNVGEDSFDEDAKIAKYILQNN